MTVEDGGAFCGVAIATEAGCGVPDWGGSDVFPVERPVPGPVCNVAFSFLAGEKQEFMGIIREMAGVATTLFQNSLVDVDEVSVPCEERSTAVGFFYVEVVSLHHSLLEMGEHLQ